MKSSVRPSEEFSAPPEKPMSETTADQGRKFSAPALGLGFRDRCRLPCMSRPRVWEFHGEFLMVNCKRTRLLIFDKCRAVFHERCPALKFQELHHCDESASTPRRSLVTLRSPPRLQLHCSIGQGSGHRQTATDH
jgi:hypothetical protein